jgi:hypothetical protein
VTSDAAASPVVSATLSLSGFADAWPHCQHVADFLARFTASDRYDPEQLTTRLSTYLHELLELVLRGGVAAAAAGDLEIAVRRRGDRLELDVAVPAAGDAGELLRRSVDRARVPDPAAAYRAGFADMVRGDDDGAGLLELVAHHGVELAVADADERLTITLRVPHE